MATSLPHIEIEFSEENYGKLSDLAGAEGLNKSTVVNRAVSLYFEMLAMKSVGVQILTKDPDGTISGWNWS